MIRDYQIIVNFFCHPCNGAEQDAVAEAEDNQGAASTLDAISSGPELLFCVSYCLLHSSASHP